MSTYTRMIITLLVVMLVASAVGAKKDGDALRFGGGGTCTTNCGTG